MYFIMMLVFIVPTGTNIMVLVELSSGNYKAKNDMATIIAYQYALAPILMSFSLAVVVDVASIPSTS